MPTKPGPPPCASRLSASRSKRPDRLVGDHRVRHALLADERGERAGVDAGKSDDAAALEPRIEMPRGAVIRRRGDGGMQNDAARARRRREIDGLDVVLVGADIADMREREGDDLAGIGRIGEDFLVAGHRGVEADLADGVAGGAKAKAFEHGTVGQHEQRRRLGLVPELLGSAVVSASARAYIICAPAPARGRICERP